MSADIIKLVFSSGQLSIRCRGCSFIGFYRAVLYFNYPSINTTNIIKNDNI